MSNIVISPLMLFRGSRVDERKVRPANIRLRHAGFEPPADYVGLIESLVEPFVADETVADSQADDSLAVMTSHEMTFGGVRDPDRV